MGSSEPWHDELLAEHRAALAASEAARERAEAATEQWVQDADLQRLSYMAADARARRAEAENERLRAALDDAADLIAEWGAYASDYFKEKWGLDDVVARIRATLSPSTEGPTDA
jgi:hypothetical protein